MSYGTNLGYVGLARYMGVLETLMHDLGIHNIFTKSITNKLFIQLIQVKKRHVEKISIIYVSFPFFREDFTHEYLPLCSFLHGQRHFLRSDLSLSYQGLNFWGGCTKSRLRGGVKASNNLVPWSHTPMTLFHFSCTYVILSKPWLCWSSKVYGGFGLINAPKHLIFCQLRELALSLMEFKSLGPSYSLK